MRGLKKLHPLTQTHGQTYGHGNSMTESAQLGKFSEISLHFKEFSKISLYFYIYIYIFNSSLTMDSESQRGSQGLEFK